MKAWKFEDNINTDLITPGRYNMTTDETQLGKIAFIEYRPEFSKNVKKGDYIIAGKNFGCGSSREHAPVALKAAGVSAVIAKSFARIFFRNCINVGLPIFICNQTELIDDGDIIQTNINENIIVNETKKISIPILSPPEFIQKIMLSGGLIEFLRRDSYV
ncbi:3-isopropylmalate dehydratase small subunit [Candidatus Bathyarchaeota archaeon]|nr:3-isopropylmalate dehydratase small subunit [Candidatus Bathyarchaeota archaeon]